MDDFDKILQTRVKFKWPYRASFDHAKLPSIKNWCEHNCQSEYRISYIHGYIQFENEKDALMFYLSWPSK